MENRVKLLEDRHQSMKKMIFKKQKTEVHQRKYFKEQALIREGNREKENEKLQKISMLRKNMERDNHDKMEKLSVKLGLVKKVDGNPDLKNVTEKPKEGEAKKEDNVFLTQNTPSRSQTALKGP